MRTRDHHFNREHHSRKFTAGGQFGDIARRGSSMGGKQQADRICSVGSGLRRLDVKNNTRMWHGKGGELSLNCVGKVACGTGASLGERACVLVQ